MWRLIGSCVAAIALLVAVGCTESPEVRIEKARIALKNGQLDSVEDLAGSVLRENAQDVNALELLAEANLRRRNIDESGDLLGRLLTIDPNHVEGHRKMVKLMQLHMGKAFSQTDFMESEKLQQEFDKALDLGRREIEWLGRNTDNATEARFLLARFAEIEATRIERALEHSTRRLSMREGQIDTGGDDERKQQAAQLRRELDAKLSDAVDYLRAALQDDPRNYEAARMMVRIHSRNDRMDHRGVWELAQGLSRQDDVPAELAEEIVLNLLRIPSEMYPLPRRVEMARAVQDAVATGQRERPVYQLTNARLMIVEEKVEDASSIIDEVLKKTPNDALALYLKGQALYAIGDYEAAKEILQKLVLQKDGDTNKAWRLYGLVLGQTGDDQLAREALRTAIDRSGGTDLLAKQALFAHTVSTGNFEYMSGQLDEMLKENPADAKALRLKLQMDIGTGDRDEVGKSMQRITDNIKPLQDEHLMVLIDGYRYLKDWDEVLRYGRQFIAMRPESVDGYMSVAEAYLKQGNLERCKQVLTDLRASHPDATSVDQLLGRLYLHAQAFDKAKDILETVVQAEPDNHVARMLLVRALASLTLTEEALEHLDVVLEARPDDLEANALAARIYQFTGNAAKADEHISRLDPELVNEAQHPVLKAQLALRQGDFELAKAICNRAIGMANNDPVLRLTLASLYGREGKDLEAENQLIQLVEAQPDNPVSYALLSRYYAQRQELEKGILQLNTLSRNNEALARLAQASLYNHFGQYDNAIRSLDPIYQPLVRKREQRALAVAEALARTYVMNRQPDEAIKVFDRLIEAEYLTSEAMLRQIDLSREVLSNEERLERLLAVSERLTPDQRELRLEVFRRIAATDLDASLTVLDKWIKLEPNEAVLYRWKGEALTRNLRLEDALDAYARGIAADPENGSLFSRKAQVERMMLDYAAAEATLRQMARIDSGSRIAAMTQLGQMFAELGLNAQALEAMGSLADHGKQRDPRVLLAMGGAYGQLGMYDRSIEVLGEIARFAPQYAAAQILLARNERRSGHVDDAQQRLQRLLGDDRLRLTAARELMMLHLSTDRDEALLEWADQLLSLEGLPDDVKKRWLTLRTTLSVGNGQWETALAALDQLKELDPQSPNYVAAQILVLMQTGKYELARRHLRNSTELQASGMGRPLAVVLGSQADGTPPGGLMTYLESIYAGQIDAARSAIEQVPPMPTVFKSDLRATLDRSDITSPEMAEAARSTIAAVLANTVGMTRLTAEFCRKALDEAPSFTIAQAMLMQALFELDDSIDPVLDLVRKNPGSAIGMYVTAIDEGLAGRPERAADLFQQLAAQEPDNHFLAYRKAEYQQKASQYDQAIETLERLASTKGAYQLVAANDLAYVLAERQPNRLPQALELAQMALASSPNNPAVQDTMGWVLHLQGDNDQALRYLNRAVVALRDRPEVQYHTAKVYEALGNTKWMRYHAQAAATGPEQIREVGLANELLSK